MNTLIAFLFVVLLAGVTIGLMLQRRLFERLRTGHPKALRVLAESSAGIMAFQRYLWKRHYRGLGDGTFMRRADLLRHYWQIIFALFLLLIAALAATIIH
jgi:hypothetical protein